jgi:hypothetical protein
VAKIKVDDYEADIFYDKISNTFRLGVNVNNSLTMIHVPLELGPTIQKLKEAIDDVHRTQSH